MSRRGRVHWLSRILSSHQAWTACGLVVPQDDASRDCGLVTCIHPGCRDQARRSLDLRLEIRSRTWDELIELKDLRDSGCGDE